jgi:hypothetical protein
MAKENGVAASNGSFRFYSNEWMQQIQRTTNGLAIAYISSKLQVAMRLGGVYFSLIRLKKDQTLSRYHLSDSPDVAASPPSGTTLTTAK